LTFAGLGVTSTDIAWEAPCENIMNDAMAARMKRYFFIIGNLGFGYSA
jgi:hypothetical protein